MLLPPTITHTPTTDLGCLLLAIPYKVIGVTDTGGVASGIVWWETLTGWGREYLRLIYGPEHTAPENLERLRPRGLAGKRLLALREFALGIESLERFVRHEPLRHVHECVFGILALESELVNPRL